MPLHILLPFGVFAAVMALMTVILLSVFFICHQRKQCRTGMFESSDLSGAHVFSSSLLSIDKDEFIETIQPKASSRSWSCAHGEADDLVSLTSDSVSLKSEVGALVPTLYQKRGTTHYQDCGVDLSRQRGKLRLFLSYNFNTSDLVVRVEEGRDLFLPGTDSINAFARISVVPSPDQRERQTSTVSGSSSPSFREEFKFPLAHESVPGRRLEAHLFHRPRAGPCVPLGWAELPLSLVDVTADTEVVAEVAEPQPQSSCGELLVSLTFLPTARRLAVGVGRARHLGGPEAPRDLTCRVELSVEGRKPRRKATASRRAAPDPEWHEAVVFHDLGPHDLAGASLELRLAEAGSVLRRGRSLGVVRLGPNASPDAVQQWSDMRAGRRPAPAVWHPLVAPDAAP